MTLDKLIQEYKEIAYKIFFTDDFAMKKKYIEKSNMIIKKIQSQKCEEEFFETLFLSSDPLILNDAARDGFNCLYNIHKCLSILEYLNANSDTIIFSSDPIKNKQLKKFCSSDESLDCYRKEVEFYDKIGNDYLYKKCHKYFNLISSQINFYYSKNSKKYKDVSKEIDSLLEELKEKGYCDIIFDITNQKYADDNHFLNNLAINAYYACKCNYEKSKYRKILKEILAENPKYLTTVLINLVNSYLYMIDNNMQSNFGDWMLIA